MSNYFFTNLQKFTADADLIRVDHHVTRTAEHREGCWTGTDKTEIRDYLEQCLPGLYHVGLRTKVDKNLEQYVFWPNKPRLLYSLVLWPELSKQNLVVITVQRCLEAFYCEDKEDFHLTMELLELWMSSNDLTKHTW